MFRDVEWWIRALIDGGFQCGAGYSRLAGGVASAECGQEGCDRDRCCVRIRCEEEFGADALCGTGNAVNSDNKDRWCSAAEVTNLLNYDGTAVECVTVSGCDRLGQCCRPFTCQG